MRSQTKVRIESMIVPPRLFKQEELIANLKIEKEEAIKLQDFELANKVKR